MLADVSKTCAAASRYVGAGAVGAGAGSTAAGPAGASAATSGLCQLSPGVSRARRALGGRVPDLDDPLVDVDGDRLRPVGLGVSLGVGLAVGLVSVFAVDVDAEPGADDDHAIALGADHERMSGLPVRHAEPHLAHLDPRRAVLEPHDARSAEHRLDASFERQPARSGREQALALGGRLQVPARRQLRCAGPEPKGSGQHQRGGARHAAGEPEPSPRARRQHRHGDRAPTPPQRHVVGAAQRRLVQRAPQLGRDLVRTVGPAVLRGHRTLFLAIAISSARA